ncbi:hypothetical protein IDH44_11280 [Paenibacillus sp. IB182496]|uniref:Uncharacterized protein n=1 Tax=Paenibacillus sabuli TaxID=2772509 RepID=A0A927GRL3_9BACL|nr:hypothetical protein [Paenibacillus sabuli]MBD2845774.1 hypothetical protein [Paenibacillus sabuli]
METILIVLGALVVIAIVVAATKSKWTTLETARGNQSDDIQDKYAYLQSKDIPSRLKSEATGATSGIAAGGSMDVASAGMGNELIKLQVRPKDKERAREAIEELKHEQVLHANTSIL